MAIACFLYSNVFKKIILHILVFTFIMLLHRIVDSKVENS